MGEAPEKMSLVESVDDVEALDFADDGRLAVLTQTTLSVDDTAHILEAIGKHFTNVRLPAKEDICYATQNRQSAVKVLASRSEVVIVIGAENSSNSQRLKEVARVNGARAHLIPDAANLERSWFENTKTVGVTAGASAPEILVQDIIRRLREWGADEVEETIVVTEDVRFALPSQVISV